MTAEAHSPKKGLWEKIRGALETKKSNIYDVVDVDGRLVFRIVPDDEITREATPETQITDLGVPQSENKPVASPPTVDVQAITDPQRALELATATLELPEYRITLDPSPSSTIESESLATKAEQAAMGGNVPENGAEVFVERIVSPFGVETRIAGILADGNNVVEFRTIATTGVLPHSGEQVFPSPYSPKTPDYQVDQLPSAAP